MLKLMILHTVLNVSTGITFHNFFGNETVVTWDNEPTWIEEKRSNLQTTWANKLLTSLVSESVSLAQN